MRPPAVPLPESARPVRWLQGESLLRTYLAQRDHCLDLFCRARAPMLPDHPGQSGPEVSLGGRRPAAARPSPSPDHGQSPLG